MKFKYKVGDKVRVISDFTKADNHGNYMMENGRGTGWALINVMRDYAGKVVTIKELDKAQNCYHIDCTGLRWTDEMFEGLVEEKKVFTKSDLKNGDVIVRSNGWVEIVIVDLGVTITNNEGWNNLSDVMEDLTDCDHGFGDSYDIVKVYRPCEKYQCTFNKDSYSRGELVYDRERDTKPKKPLYNGKVVCVDLTTNSTHYTVGKIYQFKDGQLTADSGKQFPKDNREAIRNTAEIYNFEDWSKWSTAKWIEIKE